jgi:hypothetical protein
MIPLFIIAIIKSSLFINYLFFLNRYSPPDSIYKKNYFKNIFLHF